MSDLSRPSSNARRADCELVPPAGTRTIVVTHDVAHRGHGPGPLGVAALDGALVLARAALDETMSRASATSRLTPSTLASRS